MIISIKQPEGDKVPPNLPPSGFEATRFHFGELRIRILRIFMALILGFCVSFVFADEIISFMEKPLLDLLPREQANLYYMGLLEKFFIYMKWSAYVGTFFVSPYIIYQIWSFVSRGLYEHEKRIVRPFLFAAFLVFVLGIIFSYYFVLPHTFKFLIDFGAKTEKPMINLTQYFSLASQLILTTALLFEIPVALVLLGALGILKVETMTKYRKHAHVGLSIVAAIVTPLPDAVSMILVLIPMCLLYEASILITKGLQKTPRKLKGFGVATIR